MSNERLEPMETTATEAAASLHNMLDVLCNSLESGTDTAALATLARETAALLISKIEKLEKN